MNVQAVFESLRHKDVWLEPVEGVPEGSNYLAAVIVRMGEIVNTYMMGRGSILNGVSPDDAQKLRVVGYQAVVAFPGNLPESKGKMDPDCYAVEVMTAERYRVGFKRRLEEALDTFERKLGRQIEWCLTFMDFDFRLQEMAPFVDYLVKFGFPRLHVFLIEDDPVPEGLVAAMMPAASQRRPAWVHECSPAEYRELRVRLLEEGSLVNPLLRRPRPLTRPRGGYHEDPPYQGEDW